MGDVNEGLLDNKNLYNDKELVDEADLDWYDYGFRNYDAQIGRFVQTDPLSDVLFAVSPFVLSGNEPIGNIDKDGLAPIPGLSGTWADLGNVVVKAAPKAGQVGSGVGRLLGSVASNAFRIGSGVVAQIGIPLEPPPPPPVLGASQSPNAGLGWDWNWLLDLTIEGLKKIGKVERDIFSGPAMPLPGAPTIPVPRDGDIGGSLRKPIVLPFDPPATVPLARPLPRVATGKTEYLYTLIATRSGSYKFEIRGLKVSKLTIKLKAGEIWKYGTSANPDYRYDVKMLQNDGLRLIPIDYGSEPYIKFMEKLHIDFYTITHGHLPPGNKIRG